MTFQHILALYAIIRPCFIKEHILGHMLTEIYIHICKECQVLNINILKIYKHI